MDSNLCKILSFVEIVILTAGAVHSEDVLQRTKRAIKCDAKFKLITNGHTACLQPSSQLRGGGLKDGDKKIIADAHNEARRKVSPPASNMLMMSWDEEIAKIATRWAENCVIEHDGNYQRYDFGRYSLGQNLAWASYKMTWAAAIKLWSDEKKDYNFYSNNSPTGAMIGHYTQMVWASSHKIGCAYAVCGSNHYYVCNYGPGGNLVGTRPYKEGSSCSACPRICNKDLCDCGDKTCFNGGTLDLNSCSCLCVKNLPFYRPSNCGLNCTDIQEPRYCPQFGPSACEKYSNVPQECPDMCKWCPAAEYKPPVTAAPRDTISYLLIISTLYLSLVLF